MLVIPDSLLDITKFTLMLGIAAVGFAPLGWAASKLNIRAVILACILWRITPRIMLAFIGGTPLYEALMSYDHPAAGIVIRTAACLYFLTPLALVGRASYQFARIYSQWGFRALGTWLRTQNLSARTWTYVHWGILLMVTSGIPSYAAQSFPDYLAKGKAAKYLLIVLCFYYPFVLVAWAMADCEPRVKEKVIAAGATPPLVALLPANNSAGVQEKAAGQKEKKKERVKGKRQINNGEQQSQDQESAVGDQDEDMHLLQQLHARSSLEGGNDSGEASGSGTVGLAGDEEQILSLYGGGDRKPSGSGNATAIAITSDDMQRAPAVTARSKALAVPLGSTGPSPLPSPAAEAPVAASASADTTPATTIVAASTANPITNTAAAAAAAAVAPTTTSVSRSTALRASAPTRTSNHEQQHPSLRIMQSRAAIPNHGQHQPFVQAQIVQPPVAQPSIVQPQLVSPVVVPPPVVQPQILQPCSLQVPQGQALAPASGGVAPSSAPPSLPTHLPSRRRRPPPLQAAHVGACHPLRQQPPSTPAPPSMRPAAYEPTPLPAAAARPGAVGHTSSAMRPGMHPHISGLIRQATMAAAHPPPPIPTAVLSPLLRTPSHSLCIVCMERERDVFLQPCGHVILCSPCCEKVLAKTGECPMCLTKVVEHVRAVLS